MLLLLDTLGSCIALVLMILLIVVWWRGTGDEKK